MDIENIARICYEVNRAYCRSIGEDPDVPWPELSEQQQISYMAGVGFNIRYREAGPRGSHESWLREKRHLGWKHGRVKDPNKKEHPCFVPYEQLPTQQKSKDFIFCTLVHLLKDRDDIPGETI